MRGLQKQRDNAHHRVCCTIASISSQGEDEGEGGKGDGEGALLLASLRRRDEGEGARRHVVVVGRRKGV